MGNYHHDHLIGVIEWLQADARLYLLKCAGYREYLGLEINPE